MSFPDTEIPTPPANGATPAPPAPRRRYAVLLLALVALAVVAAAAGVGAYFALRPSSGKPTPATAPATTAVAPAAAATTAAPPTPSLPTMLDTKAACVRLLPLLDKATGLINVLVAGTARTMPSHDEVQTVLDGLTALGKQAPIGMTVDIGTVEQALISADRDERFDTRRYGAAHDRLVLECNPQSG